MNENNRSGRVGDSLSAFAPRQGFERLTLKRESPELKVLLDKLVSGQQPVGQDINGNRQIDLPMNQLAERISDNTANSVSDAEAIFQLLPDIELARQILVSSIISPKDMVNTDLTYRLSGRLEDSEVNSKLLAVIEEHFEKSHKIRQKLPEMLSDMLFKTGSYPLGVLPETAIDDAINSRNRVTSLEAIATEVEVDKAYSMRSYGLLGNKRGDGKSSHAFSLESLIRPGSRDAYDPKVPDSGGMLEITDNFNVLKMPALTEKLKKDRIQDILSSNNVGMESRQIGTAHLERSLYRRRIHEFTPVLKMKTIKEAGRRPVGHPLVVKFPSESVIPVHVPGSPKEHIGFFVVLDEFGNPVNRSQYSDYYRSLGSRFVETDKNSQMSAMIQKASEAYGGDQRGSREHIEALTQSYSNIVENELLERLRNGVESDGNFVISNPEEPYRIMLARACQNMRTQLLYIPAELMTYMAFDYNAFGVGRSLLEASKIISGIRAMLMFADTMAAIRNSVGRVGLKINLDPQDNDPSGTVEFLLHEYLKTRQTAYPLGVSDPSGIITYLQNSAVDLVVSGNSAYPETSVDVEDKSSQIVRVDSEIAENLRKHHIMSFGLSPEAVDGTYNLELATSVVSSNLLLSKRVIVYQDAFCPMIADHIRKYILNSADMMDELRAIAKENISKLPKLEEVEGKEVSNEDKEAYLIETYLLEFLNDFEVALPRPDVVTLTNQMEAFNAYLEGLDVAINNYISSDFLTSDLLGDTGIDIDTVKAAFKASLARQWLRENNVFPELIDLTNVSDKDGKGSRFFEAFREHVETMGSTLEGFSEFIREQQAKATKRKEEYDAKLEERFGTAPELDGGSDSGGGEENTDDTGGDEDFDLGGGPDDLGGLDETTGDEPVEEEAPAEEEPAEEEPKEEEPKPEEEAPKEEEPKETEEPAEEELKEPDDKA